MKVRQGCKHFGRQVVETSKFVQWFLLLGALDLELPSSHSSNDSDFEMPSVFLEYLCKNALH